MKAKFNYKSKKTIIVGIIVLALIVISAIAVGAFLKGNESAEAAGNTTGNTINNNEIENVQSNNNSNKNNNVLDNNEKEQPNTNNKQEENNNQNTNNEQEVNNQQNENQQNNAAQNTNQNQQNNNTQNTNNQGNTNIPNQEFVTERIEIIPERVISESYYVSWKPTKFDTLIDGTISIEKASIEAKKTVAKVTTNGLEQNPQSVKVGEVLRYTITLTNTSQKVNGVVNVTDAIPSGTEFVSATETNLTTNPKTYQNPNEVTSLTWKNLKVKAGTEVKLEVNVKVLPQIDNEPVKSVKNIAKMNDGETEKDVPSEETKVANIIANKTSKIIYNEEKPHNHVATQGIEHLHEQDIIEYTITLTNIGLGEGTAKVTDTVPKGTTLIKNGVVTVVDKNGESTYEISDLVEGIDVTVGAANEDAVGRATVTFRVIVNSFDEETKIIRNDMAKVDGTPTNTTEDEAEKLYVSIPATKVWENIESDAAKAYAIAGIKLQVLGNNNFVAEKVVTARENWCTIFEKLPKYDLNGNAIEYTVAESVVNAEDQAKLEKYTTNIDQETGVITNTFDQGKVQDETISLTARKVWANMESDAAKAYALSSIIIEARVYGENGTYAIADRKEVSASNNWTAEFTSLKKYDVNGKEIIYIIAEAVANAADQAKLDKYISSVNQETRVITNTFDLSKVTDTIDIPATKVWENITSDAAKAYSLTSIKLQVLGNNSLVQERVVTAGDNWSTIFEDLPKYDSNGKEIVYTIAEAVLDTIDQAKLDKYIPSINQETRAITNTFDLTKVTDTIDVPATKVWENITSDAAKAYALTSIKLQVLGDNSLVEERVVTAGDNWSTIFEDLPKYDSNGKEIVYTIAEAVANIADQAKLDKYISSANQETRVITNTFDLSKVTDTIDVPATKVWENMTSDAAKAYALTSIKLQVLGDNRLVEERVVTAGNNWSTIFEDLPKYDLNGKEIVYTIAEAVVDTIDQAKLDKYIANINQETRVITNTFDLTKITDTVDVTITKVWEDNSNIYTTRPENVVLTLNGTNYTLNTTNDTDSTTSDVWTLKIEKLPKYDAQGNEIEYKEVTENNVPNGYTKSENGLVVTNVADIIVEKSVHKANEDGSIGSEPAETDKFKAGDIIYYTLSFKNAGNTVVNSKTLTDTISLKLDLLQIGSITQLIDTATGQSSLTTGTDDYGYTWTVTKNENGNAVVNWTLTDIEPGGFRQLIIKTRISGEVEYQELHQKTGVATDYTATLYVRKDGKVPYNGSGLSDTAENYTNSLGTVYLHRDNLTYDAEANLISDDIFYALKNNHNIVDMVSKGITRAELKTALQQNGITLAPDEIVLWYTIKSDNNEYKIYGVIRKITDPELSQITNAVCMDQVIHDETKIDLEELIIAQDGTVTINVNSTTTENVAVPMDVVFVLDVSGSMDGSNANHMVSAVNGSISTIMEEDSDTRIGIVTFSSSSNVKTLVPLAKYNTTGNYLTYSREKGKFAISQITENVTGNSNSVYTTGGTFTQAGIKAGAEMLTSQSVTTFQTTTPSGGTASGTRTPVLILITDGDPTYYNNKADLSGNNSGNGSDTSASHSYWTIRTAKHYKDAITAKYYGTTPQSEAKFFTIGIGLDDELAITTLNPNKTNVDNLKYEIDYWGNQENADSDSKEMQLYNLLNANGTPYAYDYANGSKTGALTENDLEAFITTSLEASSEITVVRAITDAETTSRRIDLTHIDTTQAFSLQIIGETTVIYDTLQKAMDANYVKLDSITGGYYVDLTTLTLDATVNINYWHEKS